MNRRGFLKFLGLGAAAAVIAPELVLDPERVLWIPGAKTFFLPSGGLQVIDVFRGGRRGGKLNTLLTIDWITQESLRVLEGNLAMMTLVNRQYDDQFYREPVEVGMTVNARTPPRYANVAIDYEKWGLVEGSRLLQLVGGTP